MTDTVGSQADAIEALYTAAGAPERWPEALVRVSDHLGVLGGLVAFHPPSPHSPFTVVGRLRDDLTKLYLRDYVMNPFAIAMAKVPTGVPFMGEALVDMAAIRRSAFHADILAPQKIEAQIALSHASLCWPGGSGGIGFVLSRRQSDNRTAIGRRLRPLVPHLLRAVDTSLSVGRQMARSSSLAGVLEQMPMPAMLLDSEGVVSFANRLAETLLTESDGLTVHARRLAATDAGAQRPLAQAVRTSLSIARGCPGEWNGTVRLPRPSGRPTLVVLVTPLPAPFHPFGCAIPARASVLVQVLTVDHGTRWRAEGLRHLFGLTSAESRVAALVGGGLTAPAAARALRVSLTTVKSHLGRTFDKTEVRSQAELASLVAQLPRSAGEGLPALDLGSTRSQADDGGAPPLGSGSRR